MHPRPSGDRGRLQQGREGGKECEYGLSFRSIMAPIGLKAVVGESKNMLHFYIHVAIRSVVTFTVWINYAALFYTS